MKRLHTVILLVLLLGGSAEGARQEKAPREQNKRYDLVSEVKDLTLRGTKVTATGVLPSKEWINPRLEPLKEEADGIYHFKFEAQRSGSESSDDPAPTGPVEFDFETLPANLHKIVVEAEGNKKEILYTGGAGNGAAEKRKASRGR